MTIISVYVTSPFVGLRLRAPHYLICGRLTSNSRNDSSMTKTVAARRPLLTLICTLGWVLRQRLCICGLSNKYALSVRGKLYRRQQAEISDIQRITTGSTPLSRKRSSLNYVSVVGTGGNLCANFSMSIAEADYPRTNTVSDLNKSLDRVAWYTFRLDFTRLGACSLAVAATLYALVEPPGLALWVFRRNCSSFRDVTWSIIFDSEHHGAIMTILADLKYFLTSYRLRYGLTKVFQSHSHLVACVQCGVTGDVAIRPSAPKSMMTLPLYFCQEDCSGGETKFCSRNSRLACTAWLEICMIDSMSSGIELLIYHSWLVLMTVSIHYLWVP